MARALSRWRSLKSWAARLPWLQGLGPTAASFPEAIVFLTGFFAALWLGSAGVFWKAAGQASNAAP
jgi:hypothetical protein